MNSQHLQLKNLMIRDKLFLKELYEGNDLEKKRKTLNFASDQKVHAFKKSLFLLFSFLTRLYF